MTVEERCDSNVEMTKEPKLGRDWRGKWVRTRRRLTNGFMEIPQGTYCRVKNSHRLAELVSDPCECCGISICVSKVNWEDLEYIGDEPVAEEQGFGEALGMGGVEE